VQAGQLLRMLLGTNNGRQRLFDELLAFYYYIMCNLFSIDVDGLLTAYEAVSKVNEASENRLNGY
jgi:hypothetical protein